MEFPGISSIKSTLWTQFGAVLMYSRFRRAALIFFIAFALPAHADILADRLVPNECDAPTTLASDTTLVSPSLIHKLLDWIDAATTYDVTDIRAEPPQITFCHSGDTVPYESHRILVDDTLNGAYDLANHRIILVRPWDPISVRDRSVLLHELIHHVQLNNRSWECLQQPEWETYKLQESYLAEHNVTSEFDWLQIFFLSKCPRDIHP